MNWLTGILLYTIIWWIVFFTALPWGNRPVERPEPGHATSAPARPRLWLKTLITTVLAALVWTFAYLAITQNWIVLEGI